MLYPFYDMDEGAFGYRNEAGDIVLQPVYSDAGPFVAGIAAVNVEGSYFAIREDGSRVLAIPLNYLQVSAEGWLQGWDSQFHYLFTCTGELVLQEAGLQRWHFPEEGMVRARKAGGWGLLDLQGNTRISFAYTSLGPVRNGWVAYFAEGKWGWLDTNGNTVVAAAFSEVGAWAHHYWYGRRNRRYELYRYDGTRVNAGDWEEFYPGSETATVVTASGRFCLDADLQEAPESPNRRYQPHPYDNGLTLYFEKGLWGYMDDERWPVVRAEYENLLPGFSEGLLAVQKNGLWGYVSFEGDLVIPYIYGKAGYFSGARAPVIKDGSLCWIDKAGGVAAPQDTDTFSF